MLNYEFLGRCRMATR